MVVEAPESAELDAPAAALVSAPEEDVVESPAAAKEERPITDLNNGFSPPYSILCVIDIQLFVLNLIIIIRTLRELSK